METELILSVGGLPPLSARGCTQLLRPLSLGRLERTINGKLVYIGKPHQKKYATVIHCEDKAPFASEGLWRGSEIRVGCLQRLWQKTNDHVVVLERDPVDGSIQVMDTWQNEVRILKQNNRELHIEKKKGPLFINYRPWLDMIVVSFSLKTNEWGLTVGWQLELEEI